MGAFSHLHGTSLMKTIDWKIVPSWIASLAVAAVALNMIVQSRGSPEEENTSPPWPGMQLAEAAWTDLAGSDRAKAIPGTDVVLVVFEDFLCPACKHFHRTALAGVEERFSSRVRVIRRSLPLEMIHPGATRLALISECAMRHGDPMQARDWLYSNGSDALTQAPESLAGHIAANDASSLEECLASPATDAAIQEDMTVAERHGIRATPTVIIDGYRLARYPDSLSLHQFLERHLNRLSGGGISPPST